MRGEGERGEGERGMEDEKKRGRVNELGRDGWVNGEKGKGELI